MTTFCLTRELRDCPCNNKRRVRLRRRAAAHRAALLSAIWIWLRINVGVVRRTSTRHDVHMWSFKPGLRRETPRPLPTDNDAEFPTPPWKRQKKWLRCGNRTNHRRWRSRTNRRDWLATFFFPSPRPSPLGRGRILHSPSEIRSAVFRPGALNRPGLSFGVPSPRGRGSG